MHTEASKTFQIQGTEVFVEGNDYLTGRVTDYVGMLYQGDAPGRGKPLKLVVNFADEVPCLPDDALKAIQGPYVSCYRQGKTVYIVSLSGASMIRLDPSTGEAHGSFDREFVEDSAQFYSMLGMTFSEILKYRGLYFLHGACVRGNGKAYLFSGRSRAGKTTAAFNLVRRGFQFVSDDSLFLFERDGEMVVSPYYTHFHVDANVVSRCPEICRARKLKDRDRGAARVQVNMSEFYGNSFVSSLRPDFVIFPQIVSDGPSFFSAVNQMNVYQRLLKQTILAVDNQVARKQLKGLERLARQTRGFDLFTGPDIYGDPGILPVLLEDMAG